LDSAGLSVFGKLMAYNHRLVAASKKKRTSPEEIGQKIHFQYKGDYVRMSLPQGILLPDVLR
jgi:AMMECR1 domain-containing protein